MSRFISLLLMAVFSSPLFAQPNEPFAFFNFADKAADHKSPIVELVLRPNGAAVYQVYLRNPLKVAKDRMTVTLATGDRNNNVIAEATDVKADAESTVKVTLVSKAKAPAPGDKAVATSVPEKLFLSVSGFTGNNTATSFGSSSHEIRVMAADEYVTPDRFVSPISGKDGIMNFEVDMLASRDGSVKVDGPVKLKLNIRPDLLSGYEPSSDEQRATETTVAPGQKVTLSARNLHFARTSGPRYLTVDVDDVKHAFVFELGSGTTPTQLRSSSAFLTVSPLQPFNRPSAEPLKAAVEILPGRYDGTIDWTLSQGSTRVKADTLKPYDVRKELEIANGLVTLKSMVKPSEIMLATSGLNGEFMLAAKHVSAKPFSATMVFDNSPPIVQFNNPPSAIERAKNLEVKVTAIDKESGIKAVTFYLGDLPFDAAKPPPGAKTGVAGPNGTFSAVFEIAEGKSAKVNAVAINNVGLASPASVSVGITDPPNAGDPNSPAKAKTGTIKGTINQASLGQPNTEVVLKDSAGKVIDTVNTNAKGEYTFEKVPPGNYVVFAEIKKYYTRGEAKVKVEADKTATADVSLKR